MMLIKKVLKSIEVIAWDTTHWPKSQCLSSDGESSGHELVTRVCGIE